MIVEHTADDGSVQILHDDTPIDVKMYKYWKARFEFYEHEARRLPHCKERQQAVFERDKSRVRMKQYARRMNGER